MPPPIASERLVAVEEKVNHISDLLSSNGDQINHELDELTESIRDLSDRLRMIENVRGTSEERLNQVIAWKNETNPKIETLQGWVNKIKGVFAVVVVISILAVYTLKDILFKLISTRGT